eukprot:CAMPEP_0115888336 /NCGR_PEP_ID=MMETSP0287-20121206/32252_1 /TAXON_ID=412157 /ORGANISM="Chrysochromulina rotalis, Strain UIO044" /LENGTH=175 /DNA_ID=CAMNT_0003345011 /DNA_START=78 /DNA_END=606 /DNA_ORIENTATION=+
MKQVGWAARGGSYAPLQILPVSSGDTPSMSRLYYALSLGCIPILISDPWMAMASPFRGLLNYSALVLQVSEVDVIRMPTVAIQRALEEVGMVHQLSQSRSGLSHAATLEAPEVGSEAAAQLRRYLDNMKRTYRAALWALDGNDLIANLTLMSALRLVASQRKEAIKLLERAHQVQ